MKTPRTRPDPSEQRGNIMLIAAITITAFAAVAAILVDLAAIRDDRAVGQASADAAAAAAGFALAESDAVRACRTAFDYLEVNLGRTLADHDCSSLPTRCSSSTLPVEVVGSADGIVARVVHPVADTHALMSATSAGTPTTTITAADGSACERIGVEVRREHQDFFASLIGEGGGTTSVHSVARASSEDEHGRPIHLLLTNPSDCAAIQVNGGGSSGGLFVSAATDPDTLEIHPGFIASDSDASTGCTGNGVIDTNGSGATVRADGEPGCAGELTPGTGEGCGVIEVFAGGGCEMPVCSGGGTIDPDPSRLPRRITRGPIDHRYNCKSAYPPALDITSCEDADLSQPFVDQLESSLLRAGPPDGYLSYEAAGHPCTIKGKPGDEVVVPPGNWWVGCSELRVQRRLVFEGGNVVLAGDLALTATGELIVNESNPATHGWAPGQPFAAEESSAGAALFVLQSGDFSKAGGATLRLQNTALFTGPDTELDFTGGSGELVWTAPTEGPFEDLAFWSESSEDHKFAGQANLQMSGIFFTPNSDLEFRGNGNAQTVEAQVVANTLELSGNGSLRLSPQFDRMVLFSSSGSSGLIR